MPILHGRVQHPVGQGAFHSAEVHLGDGDRPFSHVYDCGSMARFDTVRGEAIERYLTGRAELDILFLSHVHVDHVRGVPQLLSTMRVRAVVMPLLTIGERLAAYLEAVNDDGGVDDDPFLRELALDPSAALGSRGVGEVIFVRGGDGRAPGSDGGGLPGPPDPAGPDDPDVSGWGKDVEGMRRWRLAGGKVFRKSELRPPSRRPVPVTVVSHDSAFVVRRRASAGDVDLWRLTTFVDDEVKNRAALFWTMLMPANFDPGVIPPDFDEHNDPTDAIKELVSTRLPFLRDAYRTVASNLNLTTMSLHSGPVREASSHDAYLRRLGRPSRWLPASDGRVSWLGTGDADLKTGELRQRFLRHYGALLKGVGTLVVPHHGSENNFDVELLERIEPDLCVVPAAQYRGWRHPGTTVVQDIASKGIALAVVTDGEPSELTEILVLGR